MYKVEHLSPGIIRVTKMDPRVPNLVIKGWALAGFDHATKATFWVDPGRWFFYSDWTGHAPSNPRWRLLCRSAAAATYVLPRKGRT